MSLPHKNKHLERNQNAKETMLRYVNEKNTDDDFMMIKMIKKPADRASYFTVITQFVSTQQTKIV